MGGTGRLHEARPYVGELMISVTAQFDCGQLPAGRLATLRVSGRPPKNGRGAYMLTFRNASWNLVYAVRIVYDDLGLLVFSPRSILLPSEKLGPVA